MFSIWNIFIYFFKPDRPYQRSANLRREAQPVKIQPIISGMTLTELQRICFNPKINFHIHIRRITQWLEKYSLQNLFFSIFNLGEWISYLFSKSSPCLSFNCLRSEASSGWLFEGAASLSQYSFPLHWA